MDIILAIVWVLAMVIYSFSSDYVLRFADNKTPALLFIKWSSLLTAMVLSFFLAKAYQSYLHQSGVWVFIGIVFVIITVSKLAFRYWLKRRLG